jgi:ParB family transcriptional regulator, chromosome partitioning protein
MAKPALGRGLGALLGGSANSQPPDLAAPPHQSVEADNRERVERVLIHRVVPCPFQPRKDFSSEALGELADSIREKGIVQPLLVRRQGEHLELIAGERRWRAAQLAGLNEVPVIIRDADDRAVLELALIENLQRENLNAIEEALGFAQLIGQFSLTQEEAAAKVGKSRASVANALRLLKLPPDVQAFVRDGRISVGHAKVLLGLNDSERQKLAVERILKKSLNVRQTEELVACLQQAAPAARGRAGGGSPATRDAHIAQLETRLQERFGSKVHLRYRQGKGSIDIQFYNDDDLERILQIAGISLE